MKRIVNPMFLKIREINIQEGHVITEDGETFMVRDLKMENLSCDCSTEKGAYDKAGRHIVEPEDHPWMICDGEGFGR